jgi:acyl carrier protein
MAGNDDTDAGLRTVLGDVLGLNPARCAALRDDSALLGALPELDSMAIATLFAAIEDRFGLMFDDADLTGETLETYGSLLALVAARHSA